MAMPGHQTPRLPLMPLNRTDRSRILTLFRWEWTYSASTAAIGNPYAESYQKTNCLFCSSAVWLKKRGSTISCGRSPGGLGYDIRMRPDNPDIMYVTDAFSGNTLKIWA